MGAVTRPIFFPTKEAWRAWLEKNHATETEVIVGYQKGAAAKGGFHHKQAVDEALCFGWIDGLGHGGATTWTVRFTPRKGKSIWSQVNIRRIEELMAEGRVHRAGLAVYERRDPRLQKLYSHENRDAGLPPAYEKKFRADKKAWAAFQAMAPSYRKAANHWVTGAKQEETRQRRLQTLIADSAAGRKVKPLAPPERAAAAKKK
jgi:uncharacterized protein YdeI (YjbR/CyaY-like superfamily)